MQIPAPKTIHVGDVSDEARLPITPNVPFLLGHHPRSWAPREVPGVGWVWLPVLSPLCIQNGTNWTKSGRGANDPPDFRPMVNKFKDRGYTVLEDTAEYLVSYPCKLPNSPIVVKGDFYCDKWEVPYISAGKYRPKRDAAAYAAWLLSLVEEGRIPEPDPMIIEDRIDRYKGQIDRLRGEPQSEGIQMKISGRQDFLQRAIDARLPKLDPKKVEKARERRKAGGKKVSLQAEPVAMKETA